MSIIFHQYLEAAAKFQRKSKEHFESKSGLVNKKMDNDVYGLRRQVISEIYAAKRLVNGDLPRVEVRITDKPVNELLRDDLKNVLGLARLGDNIIWIPENTISDGYNLKEIVYHELIHAIFDVRHVTDCKLMNPHYNGHLTNNELDKLFLKYYKQWKKSNE